MFEITLSECTAPRIVIVEGVIRSCLYLSPEKPLTEVKSSGEGKGRVVVRPPIAPLRASLRACMRMCVHCMGVTSPKIVLSHTTN